MYLLLRIWIVLIFRCNVIDAFSASAAKKKPVKRRVKSKQQGSSTTNSLAFTLQKCTTPAQVLQKVALELPSDPQGANLASTTLVRLSKQLTTLQNEHLHPTADQQQKNILNWNQHVERKIFPSQDASEAIEQVIQTLVQSTTSSLEALIEGTKATAVLARLIPDIVTMHTCQPLLQCWKHNSQQLEVHQLSGLHWAFACFQHVYKDLQLPAQLQQAYKDCNLPFWILPGFLEDIPNLSVANLVAQVPFQVDAIRTTSTSRVVPERRETAWLGDEGVAPFAYSGKSMPRHDWTPLVETIRDQLAETKSPHPVYYDGCLLNHYPDGGSAMRYHIDPDQGQLWDFSTVVVSVGASRRVAFRGIPTDKQNAKQQPHNFVVMQGDVMVMVDDCQSRFQHAVKPADNKHEQAARASLVFKKTLS